MLKESAGSSKRPQWPFVLYYDTAVVAVSVAGMVQLVSRLNGLIVHNTGNTVCSVNGDPLQPGESKTFGGNWGEIFTGRIFLQFSPTTPPAAVPVNLAIITLKFYVPPPAITGPEDLNAILGQ